MTESSIVCAVCDCEVIPEDMITVYKRGLKTFTNYSQERDDDKWKNWLQCERLHLHKSCRLRYLSKHNVVTATKRKLSVDVNEAEPSTRPSDSATVFDFVHCCIFCGENCKAEVKKAKNKRRLIHVCASDSPLTEHILRVCKKLTDEISLMVVKRISVKNVEAHQYHHDCLQNFLRLREYDDTEKINTAKYSKQLEDLFTRLENCQYRQWSLDERIEEMGEPVPCKHYVKNVLSKKYSDQIIFSSCGSAPTVVTFRSYANYIFIMNYRNSDFTDPENINLKKITT